MQTLRPVHNLHYEALSVYFDKVPTNDYPLHSQWQSLYRSKNLEHFPLLRGQSNVRRNAVVMRQTGWKLWDTYTLNA